MIWSTSLPTKPTSVNFVASTWMEVRVRVRVRVKGESLRVRVRVRVRIGGWLGLG